MINTVEKTDDDENISHYTGSFFLRQLLFPGFQWLKMYSALINEDCVDLPVRSHPRSHVLSAQHQVSRYSISLRSDVISVVWFSPFQIEKIMTLIGAGIDFSKEQESSLTGTTR